MIIPHDVIRRPLWRRIGSAGNCRRCPRTEARLLVANITSRKPRVNRDSLAVVVLQSKRPRARVGQPLTHATRWPGWTQLAGLASHMGGGRLTMAMFVTVVKTDDLQPGQGKLVEVNHKRIALFNVGGRYYAIDDVCPHRGGPLSEGELERGTVVCPWHGAIFDLNTGAVTRLPATAGVTTYEVRVEGEGIAVAV